MSCVAATAVAVLIYSSIFTAVLLTDQLPLVPSHINLTQSLSDLQHLTAHPHPYNSHSNDIARAYVLSRLRPIAAAHPTHVHISDDLVSNGSWANAGVTGVYFEGTNVLVKVDGTDSERHGGVLFSAHYDSVSTAPGATDNGMAVATLLRLVQLFAENRGRKTVVFNINNGEEDGMNGAHAFLQHPWSNLTDTFLNLEGAASGGRPLVFRSSSLPPLRSFLPSHVPHPHANVLSADVFARGVIRSDTDYSIYTGLHARSNPNSGSRGQVKTMQGLDYAFYKHRSRYHTKYDAVPYTEGGRRALWSMIEGTAGAGRALADEGDESPVKGAGAVYFDLFASTLIIFPLPVLQTFNIVFLAITPFLVVLLSLCVRLIRRRRVTTGTTTVTEQSHRHLYGLLRRTWIRTRWTLVSTWFRFWLSLVLSISAQVGLVVGYAKFNPYIIHSAPYLVLTTFFTLSYLTIYLALTLQPPSQNSNSNPNNTPKKTANQTRSTLTQLLLLSYLLLLPSTVFLPADIGGTYPLSAFAWCVFLGWLVGCVRDIVFGGGEDEDHEGEGEEGEERRLVRGVRFEVDHEADVAGRSNGEGRSGAGREVETEPTEITPLLIQQRDAGGGRSPTRNRADGEGRDPRGWWILQILLVVPFPVILLTHILVLLIDSMGQSVIDGGPVWLVYALPSTVISLLLYPLAPFMHKIHRGISYFFLIVFGFTILYTWGVFGLLTKGKGEVEAEGSGFPFSSEAPLKIYFQQSVQILPPLQASSLNGSKSNTNTNTTTHLTSVPYYLERLVVPALPSATRESESGSGVHCGGMDERVGLVTCVWDSGDPSMLPQTGFWGSPENGDKDDWETGIDTNIGGTGAGIDKKNWTIVEIPSNPWFAGNVTRLSNDSTVKFVLRGRNTRNCRIYFEPGVHRAVGYVVRGAEGMQSGYEVGDKGVREVRLWSRTWGREWVVDVDFEDRVKGDWEGEEKIKGRVACEWAEYESATVGVYESGRSGKIPALEEALEFLPRWAVVTKIADGLVEVWSEFEV